MGAWQNIISKCEQVISGTNHRMIQDPFLYAGMRRFVRIYYFTNAFGDTRTFFLLRTYVWVCAYEYYLSVFRRICRFGPSFLLRTYVLVCAYVYFSIFGFIRGFSHTYVGLRIYVKTNRRTYVFQINYWWLLSIWRKARTYVLEYLYVGMYVYQTVEKTTYLY